MEQKKIDRINELARKKKQDGLTAEELEEQAQLRREYIDSFKSSMRSQLDNLVVIDQEGNKMSVKEANRKLKH